MVIYRSCSLSLAKIEVPDCILEFLFEVETLEVILGNIGCSFEKSLVKIIRLRMNGIIWGNSFHMIVRRKFFFFLSKLIVIKLLIHNMLILLLVEIALGVGQSCKWTDQEGTSYDLARLDQPGGWQIHDEESDVGLFSMVYIFNFCDFTEIKCHERQVGIYEALSVGDCDEYLF